ncbi:MAG: ABC transporter ATP-binding protein, partial [Thermoleophilaceae bacterium]|nr:ABC transporter ATP-binding protein [Thermoleophilaceae bacterium]
FGVTRIWRVVQPYYGGSVRELVALSFTSLVSGLSEAGILYLLVRLAIAISSGDDAVNLSIGPIHGHEIPVTTLLGAAFVLLAVRTLLALIEGLVTAKIAAETLRLTRRKALSDFLAADWAEQSREREGQLQELLSTHATKIAAGATVISTALISFFNFAAVLGSAVVIDAVAAGTCLVAAVVLGVVLRPLMARTRRYAHQFASASNEYSARVSETVRLAQESQVFQVSDRMAELMGRRVDDSVRPFLRSRFVARFTPDVYQSIAFAFVLGALAVVRAVAVGDATELGAVVLLLLRALTYSQALQSVLQQANEMAPYVTEYSATYERYERSRRHPGSEALGPIRDLRFDRVSFAYTPTAPVLREVTFGLVPGEAMGIAGPSGSGKSTLVQLLLRLRPPATGQYLVNGALASTYDPMEFASRFSYVPQDNKLLFGSVAENIRFFRGGYTDDDVEITARRAHLHDEIVRFPEGYDTTIGPGGADLSGGQRQRLGLARALLSRPEVLVLDEPTSALDLRSEALIQETLAELHGEVTLVVIAHRTSTLAECDRLMVLRDGVIDAIGPSAELLGTHPFLQASPGAGPGAAIAELEAL